jgi:hypothetical protein
MRSALLLVVVFNLAACKTIGPCDFSPATQGWKAINTAPEDLVRVAGRVDSWYVNDKQQFLACLNNHGAGLCGGNYLVYAKADVGYVRKDIVVCTSE